MFHPFSLLSQPFTAEPPALYSLDRHQLQFLLAAAGEELSRFRDKGSQDVGPVDLAPQDGSAWGNPVERTRSVERCG